MRSGYVAINNGYLWSTGVFGYMWSSVSSSEHRTGANTLSAYYFGITDVNIFPSGGPYDRWLGFPLRGLGGGGGNRPNGFPAHVIDELILDPV